MGRPKVKIIDDSQPDSSLRSASGRSGNLDSAPKKFEPHKIAKKGGDSLIESLKAELGIEDSKPVIASEAKQSSSDVDSTKIAASSSTPRNDEKKAKKTKPGKINRSKKYQSKVEEINAESPEEEKVDFRTKTYKLNDALELVKKTSYSKFPGTLEAHINTISTGIRGTISLPFASGKKMIVVAFGKGAEASGADIIGDEKVLGDIKSGKMSFDVLVTTPEWMPKFSPLARILGPRGLMPNPKNGTIATNADTLKKAVEGYHAGKTEYKTESKAPVMHLAMGKLDQPTEELAANIKALLQVLGKSRIRKVALAPTMGPSVKLDLSSI